MKQLSYSMKFYSFTMSYNFKAKWCFLVYCVPLQMVATEFWQLHAMIIVVALLISHTLNRQAISLQKYYRLFSRSLTIKLCLTITLNRIS